MSRATKLVAAFNHVHIFIDPDPDPAKSFAERERLFQLPRSTWRDYDADAHQQGRRHLRPLGQGHPALAGDAEAARPRGASAPAGEEVIRRILTAQRGPALQRRHRHLREGRRPRTTPRWATAPTTACAWTARRCARAWWARAATWASPSAAASSTGRAGGAAQHRRRGQLGRRRHVRPRGEHQDPDGPPREEGRGQGPRGAQPHPRGDDRGGGGAGAGRQREPGPRPSPSTACAAPRATRSSWPSSRTWWAPGVLNRADDADPRPATELLASPQRERGLPRPLLAVLLGHTKMWAFEMVMETDFPDSDAGPAASSTPTSRSACASASPQHFAGALPAPRDRRPPPPSTTWSTTRASRSSRG